jgi:tRNA A22 N-methylase
MHILQSLSSQATQRDAQDCGALYFLLSPTNNMFRLRQDAKTLNLDLESEGFIAERGRAYEYLLLRVRSRYAENKQDDKAISTVGKFWQLSDDRNCSQSLYIQKLLAHYQRQQQFIHTGGHQSQELIEEVALAVESYGVLLNQSSDT